MLWCGIIIASNGNFLESRLLELTVTAVMVMNVDRSNKLSHTSLHCMLPCHMLHFVTWDMVHHFVGVVGNCQQETKFVVQILNKSCRQSTVRQDGIPTRMLFAYLLTDCEEPLRVLQGRRLLNVK
jgi:hypothetical protein